jgi:hypothetical protein
MQDYQKQIDALMVPPVFLDDTKHKMEEVSDEARDMSHAIGTAFEDAILKGEKFSDVLKGLLDDIARIALRVAVTKPLENALTGALSTGLSGLFGGSTASMAARYPNSAADVPGISGLQGFATGSDYVPRTGPYMLHQGEAVIPAGQNRGANIVTNIDARGATQEAIPGIVAALNNHERALERLVSNDAYRRGGSTRQLLRR